MFPAKLGNSLQFHSTRTESTKCLFGAFRPPSTKKLTPSSNHYTHNCHLRETMISHWNEKWIWSCWPHENKYKKKTVYKCCATLKAELWQLKYHPPRVFVALRASNAVDFVIAALFFDENKLWSHWNGMSRKSIRGKFVCASVRFIRSVVKWLACFFGRSQVWPLVK